MSPSPYLLFPLASSVAYVFALLCFKRSGDWGVGVSGSSYLSNVAIGLVSSPLWLLGGEGQGTAPPWQPLVLALLFLSGQMFTFLSPHFGDVSVGTPVMGVKIVLVASASALL